jgi:hypothetical protein
VPEGSEVHEEQMAALFGETLHPNAVDITNYMLGRGAQPAVAIEAAQLGRRFAVRTGETEFQRALAAAYRDHNARLGQKCANFGANSADLGDDVGSGCGAFFTDPAHRCVALHEPQPRTATDTAAGSLIPDLL